MTIAELDRWALHRNWGAPRRSELATFLERFTAVMSDRRLCRTWAEVADTARRNGRQIHVADAWITATTLSLGVPLLTHNRGDFLGVDGLRLVTP
jgi:predicted nucleic acid-binding protein